MNICYLIRKFGNRGGSENYVYNMARALSRMGHRVHIVTTTGVDAWDFQGLEDKISVHVFPFREEAFPGSWRIEKFIPWYAWRFSRFYKKILPGLIKKYGIDIIEATDWGQDAAAYLDERTVPVCVRLHGHPEVKERLEQGTLKQGTKNRLVWESARQHLLGADLITAVSRSYAGLAAQAWDIPSQKIQVIPIGINPEIFYPSGQARKDKTVLFAGRLEKHKGMEVLSQAIPLVLQKMPDARFLIAGRDMQRQPGQTWSQYLLQGKENGHLQYLGPVPIKELVKLYQSSTLCVAPSLYEPGGMVAIEAMFCACPVVASRVGGLAENIKDHETGLLTTPGDPRALADAVIELMEKPELRKSLSKNSFEFSTKNYNLESVAKQMVKAYTQAIDTFKK